jgi:hypothetical protein
MTNKPEPTHAEMREQLAVALGLCWHETIEVHNCGYDGWTKCSCGQRDCDKLNPTFFSALEVLEAMKERLSEERFRDFLSYLYKQLYPNNDEEQLPILTISSGINFITKFFLTQYAMLKAAWEFVRERK